MSFSESGMSTEPFASALKALKWLPEAGRLDGLVSDIFDRVLRAAHSQPTALEATPDLQINPVLWGQEQLLDFNQKVVSSHMQVLHAHVAQLEKMSKYHKEQAELHRRQRDEAATAMREHVDAAETSRVQKHQLQTQITMLASRLDHINKEVRDGFDVFSTVP